MMNIVMDYIEYKEFNKEALENLQENEFFFIIDEIAKDNIL